MFFLTFLCLLTIQISLSKPTINCDEILKIHVNQEYFKAIEINNVTYPYTLEVVGLPQGLKLEGTIIKGKVLQQGSFPVNITVDDASKIRVSKNIFLSCIAAPKNQSTLIMNTPITQIINQNQVNLPNLSFKIPQVTVSITQNSNNNIFQQQSNINSQLSILLSSVQSNNLTLSKIESDITVSQSILQKQQVEYKHLEDILKSILSQNTTLSENISYTKSNIQSLQKQINFGNSTLNPLSNSLNLIQNRINEQKTKLEQVKRKQIQTNQTSEQMLKQQKQLSSIIFQKNAIIQKARQNISETKQTIANSNTYKQKIQYTMTLQQNIVTDLQKQLAESKKKLSQITRQFEYYSTISTTGPMMIQQNQTIIDIQTVNINNNLNPLLQKIRTEHQKQTDQMNSLAIEASSIQVQISTMNINYQNMIGAKNTQQKALNSTTIDVDVLKNKYQYFQSQLDIVAEKYKSTQQTLNMAKLNIKNTNNELQKLKLRKKNISQDIVLKQAKIELLKKQKIIIDQQISKKISQQNLILSTPVPQSKMMTLPQKWLGIDNSKLSQTNFIMKSLQAFNCTARGDSQVLLKDGAVILSISPKWIQALQKGKKYRLMLSNCTVSKSNSKQLNPRVGDKIGWSGVIKQQSKSMIKVNVNKLVYLSKNVQF